LHTESLRELLCTMNDTPEDNMGIFGKPEFNPGKRRELPAGLWTKCPGCEEIIHNLEIERNLRICPKCEHHFPVTAKDRIELMLDSGTFEEHDSELTSVDTLKFTGQASYTDRLRKYQKATGLNDAVLCGLGKIGGRPVSMAVMDFNFLAATMGSVVGEKITRAIERATEKRLPIIIISASGGARMYEGMLSLMQMAKTCGALARHADARLPYISVLTNPTTAGVMASYASVGDIIIAEPKCMIGFAGPRVIRETTHQELPPGFQTAEFCKDHGLVDMIVHRRKMKETLSGLLAYLGPRA
jgi:acetyl-CoA carboxylase carboxyl transferase subunit beta